MSHVGALRRQHDLGIRGYLDLAHTGAEITDRELPDLDVVFGRDQHFQFGQD